MLVNLSENEISYQSEQVLRVGSYVRIEGKTYQVVSRQLNDADKLSIRWSYKLTKVEVIVIGATKLSTQ